MPDSDSSGQHISIAAAGKIAVYEFVIGLSGAEMRSALVHLADRYPAAFAEARRHILQRRSES